jgi:succinyl-CoA synthetase beta subunit
MPHHGRRIAAALELTGDLSKQAPRSRSRSTTHFVATDASQIEINPLAVTEHGNLLVLDAKVGFDGNALFRHPT